MRRLVDLYFAVLRLGIALLLAAMVVLVFGNVVLRYAANSGITASEELSRLAFVWLIFLGAVVALREHAHIGIDTMIRALPLPLARACVALSYLLMILACGLLLQGSFAQAVINWSSVTPATGISMAWFHIPAIAFAVPALLILSAELLGILTGRIDLATAVLVQESEELPPPEATGAGPRAAAGLGR